MGLINKGTFDFSANFNRKIAANLDGSLQVENYADLFDSSVIEYPYLFMLVAVHLDQDVTKQGIWYLVGDDITVTDNWKLLCDLNGVAGGVPDSVIDTLVDFIQETFYTVNNTTTYDLFVNYMGLKIIVPAGTIFERPVPSTIPFQIDLGSDDPLTGLMTVDINGAGPVSPDYVTGNTGIFYTVQDSNPHPLDYTINVVAAAAILDFTFNNNSLNPIQTVYVGGTSGNPDSNDVIQPGGSLTFSFTTSDESRDFLSLVDDNYSIDCGPIQSPESEFTVGQSFFQPISQQIIAILAQAFNVSVFNVGVPVATTTTTTSTQAPLPQITLVNNTSDPLDYTYTVQGTTGTIQPGDIYVTTFNSASQGAGEQINFPAANRRYTSTSINGSVNINQGSTFSFSYIGQAITNTITDWVQGNFNFQNNSGYDMKGFYVPPNDPTIEQFDIPNGTTYTTAFEVNSGSGQRTDIFFMTNDVTDGRTLDLYFNGQDGNGDQFIENLTCSTHQHFLSLSNPDSANNYIYKLQIH